MTAAALALALSLVFPSLGARLSLESLAALLVASATSHGVRPALLAAVGWRESRFGTDPRLRGNPQARGAFGLRPSGVESLCRRGRARCEGGPLASQADAAAAVLQAGRAACGGEAGALRYFHSGACGRRADTYAEETLRLARALERASPQRDPRRGPPRARPRAPRRRPHHDS